MSAAKYAVGTIEPTGYLHPCYKSWLIAIVISPVSGIGTKLCFSRNINKEAHCDKYVGWQQAGYRCVMEGADIEFRGNADLSQSELASRFATQGSLSIPDFLPLDQAEALLEHIKARPDWLEIFRGAGRAYEMPVAAFEALGHDQTDELERLVWAAARQGFQYRYRSIRVPDDLAVRREQVTPLSAFAQFMASEPMLRQFRTLLGNNAINFADAQATAYSANHFLTDHDDAVEGKGRVAAYVYSLTHDWSADWGGLLILQEQDLITGYVPQFNSLRIFSVPQPHSVTFVPPFVEKTRYSITGWLRIVEPGQTGS